MSLSMISDNAKGCNYCICTHQLANIRTVRNALWMKNYFDNSSNPQRTSKQKMVSSSALVEPGSLPPVRPVWGVPCNGSDRPVWVEVAAIRDFPKARPAG